MKKLYLIAVLAVAVAGCCMFGAWNKVQQECNVTKSVCAGNAQELKHSLKKFKADGGMYIVQNVSRDKIVEKTSINFDENTKIWAYNPLRVFYLTAGLNSGALSQKDIVFYTNSPDDFKKVAEADKTRAFMALGVDDFNTPQQLLLGYLNVFANKGNLLNKLQLNTLQNAVAESVKSGANVDGADVIGLAATSDYKLKKGEVITLFVGTFKAHGEDYAIVTVLDNPKGIKSTYGFNSSGWNAVPLAAEIIKNITNK